MYWELKKTFFFKEKRWGEIRWYLSPVHKLWIPNNTISTLRLCLKEEKSNLSTRTVYAEINVSCLPIIYYHILWLFSSRVQECENRSHCENTSPLHDMFFTAARYPHCCAYQHRCAYSALPHHISKRYPHANVGFIRKRFIRKRSPKEIF